MELTLTPLSAPVLAPASLTHKTCRLLESLLAGEAWSPEEHCCYPPAFRAAARTLALINGTANRVNSISRVAGRRRLTQPAGGGGNPTGRQQQMVMGSQGRGWRYMPPELLQRIVGLVAAPLTAWIAMEPDGSF